MDEICDLESGNPVDAARPPARQPTAGVPIIRPVFQTGV